MKSINWQDPVDVEAFALLIERTARLSLAMNKEVKVERLAAVLYVMHSINVVLNLLDFEVNQNIKEKVASVVAPLIDEFYGKLPQIKNLPQKGQVTK